MNIIMELEFKDDLNPLKTIINELRTDAFIINEIRDDGNFF